jgi:hypothetical protein
MPRVGRREYRRMVQPFVSRITDTLAIARCYEQMLCHRREGLMSKGRDRTSMGHSRRPKLTIGKFCKCGGD